MQTGIPITGAYTSQLTGAGASFGSTAFERPPISVGPTFIVLFYDRIGVEFDALYKQVRFEGTFTSFPSTSTSTSRGESWEFPLLGNYRFLDGPIRPFGGGGLVLGSKLSGTTEFRSVDTRTGAVTTSTGSFRRNFDTQVPAFVVQGGLEWRTTHVVVKPELRFTHWDSVSQSTNIARREKQLEYLVGITFRGFGR